MKVNIGEDYKMQIFTDKIYDEERALYGTDSAKILNCRFEGPADGESALKEASDLKIENCSFLLRYPLWHVTNAEMTNCEMSETCRAALWYDEDIKIDSSYLGGIKALRECKNVHISNSKIKSTEFGWFCDGVRIENTSMESEYPFLKCMNMEFDVLKMSAKYSFQYAENLVLRNCELNTKDAFWHGKNITVYDSIIKGEYLAWYSDSLRLVRCKIIGTQPLCYAKNLVLEDCEMTDCDLSFEKSYVQATVKGHIDSVKNPISGFIKADSIGEIINEYPENKCEITVSDN